MGVIHWYSDTQPMGVFIGTLIPKPMGGIHWYSDTQPMGVIHWYFNTQTNGGYSLVIEHVANPAEFCKSLAALTVPDGATIISTINRSMRSYATAIVAAEYLLHWLPKGTHEWSSFLTPEELVLILQRANITVREMAGFVYNPLTGRWSLSDDISVNFIAFGTKNCQ
ncbi:hypothetical protein SO802_015976 [Lithocarpus litseifolius]|uniref:Uncharacterized protein n=1 Tax=Lithocarpus litseifolius TaxID=425828 RepID=A0AAW2CYI3_9ROSI